MFLFSGRKSKIFLTVFLLSGVFLFVFNSKTVQAYHATSSYSKLFNDTLTSQNWNDLLFGPSGVPGSGDFVNTWLPVTLNGPVGIATSSPNSGLEVNGIIRGGSFFSSGFIGVGLTDPSASLQVAPTSGSTYGILAAAAGGAYRIGNVDDPSADYDAANKYYVDATVSSATSSMITMPIGTNGQTLRNSSGTWVATSNLFNDGANIGIGTTSPTGKLQVEGGQVAFGGAPSGSAWLMTLRSDYPWTAIDASGTAVFELYAGTKQMRLLGGVKLIAYNQDLTFGNISGATTADFMTIKNTSGNVGIGTMNPSGILDIESGVGTGGGKYVEFYNNVGGVNPSSTGGLFFGWNKTNGSGESIIGYNTQIGGEPRLDFSSWNGSTYTTEMTIKSGSVGIGTTTPSALLHVAPSSGNYSILAGGTALTAYRIGNVGDPSADYDAANKYYVDSFVTSYVATATGTITGVAHYVGITPTAYTGNNNGSSGYVTAENACKVTFASSTVCTPDNILNSIVQGITLPAEDVWIFAGPPGYTAAANDCEGRSAGTTAAYGTYWQIAMTGRPQGRGLLMTCNNSLRLACCR